MTTDELRTRILDEVKSIQAQRDQAYATYQQAVGALSALDGLLQLMVDAAASVAETMTVDQLQDAINRGANGADKDASP